MSANSSPTTTKTSSLLKGRLGPSVNNINLSFPRTPPPDSIRSTPSAPPPRLGLRATPRHVGLLFPTTNSPQTSRSTPQDISGTESSDYIFIPRPSESDYISNTTQSWSAASQQLSPHASNDESTYEARTSGWADSDDGSRFAAPSDSPVLPPSQNWRSTQSDYFRWIAIPKLSRAFFAPQVLERVGTPVSFLIKDNFIVGTNMGKVVICDAQAQVKAIVGSRELDNLLVSSIAMSADNTSLLVGYSDGRLIAWDWKANSPTVTCEPRDLRDTHRPNTKSSPCCHPTGVPITHVAFIGVSKHRFVSGDAMGHAIYHHIIRRVVVTSVKSELLLPLANNSHIRINSLADLSADPLAETAGGDEEEEEDAGSNVSDLPCLYALASLPYGTLEHTTDHIGLVAAISGEKMLVYRTNPHVELLYSVDCSLAYRGLLSRPAFSTSGTSPSTQQQQQRGIPRTYSGCVSWMPALVPRSKDYESSTPPKLAYSWGSYVAVVSVSAANVTSEHHGMTQESELSSESQSLLLPSLASNSNNNNNNNDSSRKKDEAKRLNFIQLLEWNAGSNIVSLHWVDHNIVLMLTEEQRLLALDIIEGIETEVYGAAPSRILSQPWISLATGNEAEPQYTYTVQAHRRRLYVLTSNEILTGKLLNWSQRLINLIADNDFVGAIVLATNLYKGTFSQVVVGLPHSSGPRITSSPTACNNLGLLQTRWSASGRGSSVEDVKRQEIVRPRLTELVKASLKYAFARLPASQHATATATAGNYQRMSRDTYIDLLKACIDAGLTIEDLTLLFEDVFDAYSETDDTTGMFIRVLESYVLDGHISYVPPSVLDAFISYYSTLDDCRERLGNCLMHLDLIAGEFDVDKVLAKCKKLHLWGAYARVWLRTLDDAVVALEDILDYISSSQGVQEEKYIEEARQVAFAFIEKIMTGHLYPESQLISPRERAERLSSSLIQFLFVPTTQTDSQDRRPEWKLYRPLMQLVQCDVSALICSMEYVIDDPFTQYISIIIQPQLLSPRDAERSIRRASAVKTVPQATIDALITIVRSHLPDTHSIEAISKADRLLGPLSREQLGMITAFVARVYTSRYPLVYIPDETIRTMMRLLLGIDSEATRRVREQATESLIAVNPPQDPTEYIESSRRVGFQRVLDSIYTHVGDYAMVLQTYLDDHHDHDEQGTARRSSVFGRLSELLDKNRVGLSPQQKQELVTAILDKAADLIQIDPLAMAKLVEANSAISHESVVESLIKRGPQQQHQTEEGEGSHMAYRYLNALLDHSPRYEGVSGDGGESRSIASKSDSSTWATTASRHGLQQKQQRQELGQIRTPRVSQDLHHTYIRLMCMYSAEDVLPYLEEHVNDQPAAFRLTHVQDLCQKYSVVGALVWIRKQFGDFDGALKILLDEMNSCGEELLGMLRQLRRSSAGADQLAVEARMQVSELSATVRDSLEVCQFATERIGKGVMLSHIDENAAGDDSLERPRKVQEQLEDLWHNLLLNILHLAHLIKYQGAAVEGSEWTQPQLSAGTGTSLPLHEYIEKQFHVSIQSVLDALVQATSPSNNTVSLPSILERLMQSELARLDKREVEEAEATGGNGEIRRGLSMLRSTSKGGTQSARESLLRFSEMQALLGTALGTYKAEGRLMELVNALMNHDLFKKAARLVQAQKQGWLIKIGPKKGFYPHRHHHLQHTAKPGVEREMVEDEEAGEGSRGGEAEAMVVTTGTAEGGGIGSRSLMKWRCFHCHQPLFKDTRRVDTMSVVYRQVQTYLENETYRVLDLRVFEERQNQWPWINLREDQFRYQQRQATTGTYFERSSKRLGVARRKRSSTTSTVSNPSSSSSGGGGGKERSRRRTHSSDEPTGLPPPPPSWLTDSHQHQHHVIMFHCGHGYHSQCQGSLSPGSQEAINKSIQARQHADSLSHSPRLEPPPPSLACFACSYGGSGTSSGSRGGGHW